MDASFDDASDEFMQAGSTPLVVEEGCEATGEVHLSSSGPEQGVPAVDPDIGTPFSSFDAAELKPCDGMPPPVSSIGKSLLITPPTRHDTGSQPMERGEPSSRPSFQYAKNVLKSILSSWIETLSFGHLEAGFGMTKRVQEILTKSEKVGLDIIGVRLLLMRSSHWATSGLQPRAFRIVTFSGKHF